MTEFKRITNIEQLGYLLQEVKRNQEAIAEHFGIELPPTLREEEREWRARFGGTGAANRGRTLPGR